MNVVSMSTEQKSSDIGIPRSPSGTQPEVRPKPTPVAPKPVAEQSKNNLLPGASREVREDVERAMNVAREAAKIFNRNVSFEYVEDVDEYQVVVKEGERIIRKIPSDEMLRLVQNINEMLGVIFDKEA